MHSYWHRIAVVGSVSSLIGLGGCATSPDAHFYLLESMPSESSQDRPESSLDGVAIGLKAVKIPGYLRRPQIVSRTSRTMLHLAEFDRWAEPLEENIPRVLAANLRSLLSTRRIVTFPWTRTTSLNYELRVEILRFDGRPGEQATLHARWSVFGPNEEPLLVMQESAYVEPAVGASYDALVAAESQLLAALSRDIAVAIQSIPARILDSSAG